jgi:hypothetical protein
MSASMDSRTVSPWWMISDTFSTYLRLLRAPPHRRQQEPRKTWSRPGMWWPGDDGCRLGYRRERAVRRRLWAALCHGVQRFQQSSRSQQGQLRSAERTLKARWSDMGCVLFRWDINQSPIQSDSSANQNDFHCHRNSHISLFRRSAPSDTYCTGVFALHQSTRCSNTP